MPCEAETDEAEIDEDRDTDADVSIKSIKVEKSEQKEESAEASESIRPSIQWKCGHCSFENTKAITACGRCGTRSRWYRQYLNDIVFKL